VLSAVTNTIVQIAIITVAGKTLFGLGWPKDWLELAVFVFAGVVCFAIVLVSQRAARAAGATEAA